MKRIGVMLAFLLAFCVSASAATMGEAFALSDSAHKAQAAVCPPEKARKPGEMPDMVRFGCLMKFEGVKMGIVGIMTSLAKKLMDECLDDVKNGKPATECNASNNKFRQYPLPAQYEPVFQKAKSMYDEAVKEYGKR